MEEVKIQAKKSETFIQFCKFCLVGVSNTAVDWIVFYILTLFVITQTELEPLVKSLAFLVAMLNSYFWNSKWTFRNEHKDKIGDGKDRGATKEIFIKFFFVSISGWAINVLTFSLVRFNLDQEKIVALIAASASATLFNFIMNKLWTYRKSD